MAWLRFFSNSPRRALSSFGESASLSAPACGQVCAWSVASLWLACAEDRGTAGHRVCERAPEMAGASISRWKVSSNVLSRLDASSVTRHSVVRQTSVCAMYRAAA